MPLLTVRGPSGPPVVHRFDQDVIGIGRSGANTLLIRDPALSRMHAEIRRAGGAWVVRDCGSRNGTLLNGRPVLEPAALRPGDEIRVGETAVVFASEEATGESGVATAGFGAADGHVLARDWSARGSGIGGEEPRLVGHSAALRQVLAAIDRIAGTSSTVLVTGENGTGKELAARLIHHRSPRASGPFVVVNCPALVGSLFEVELYGVERGVATGVEARPGRVELASGGTLFLDEIGDLDVAAQAKLLRFLQDRMLDRVGGRKPVKLDVRVVAATNQDLAAAVARGSFRRDLFHRLDVLTLKLPPLRERREDIPVLVDHFLARPEGPRVSFSPEALELLQRHDFPGNVRELEHLVERLRYQSAGPVVLPGDLPANLPGDAGQTLPSAPGGAEEDRLYRQVVAEGLSFWSVVQQPFIRRELSREVVQRLIERAYREAGGSYKQVARLFGIEADHKKLLNFLRNHGLRVGK